jgi:hypothetical protein
MELSLLCNVEVQMMIEDVTHGKYISYKSQEYIDLFTKVRKDQIKESFSNKDVNILPLKFRNLRFLITLIYSTDALRNASE